MAEYIEKEIAKDVFCGRCIWKRSNECSECEHQIDNIPPADVVSWAHLERYANWFCADVSFPEFIREAKAFLKASGGFQEGNEIYD